MYSYSCFMMTTTVPKCRLFFQTFFPKLNISKVRFSLHSTNDTCDIQIGIPIYRKLISESVVWNSRSAWCLITVLISSPQHQQPPPPRPWLLSSWLQSNTYCCWVAAVVGPWQPSVVVVEMLLSVVEHHCSRLHGWPRLVQGTLPVTRLSSTAHLAGAHSSQSTLVLVECWAYGLAD